MQLLSQGEWKKMQDTNAKAEEAAGIRCGFETECHWKWNQTQNDTFQVVTGSNITHSGSLLPGPSADNAGDVKGKCSIRTLILIFNQKFNTILFPNPQTHTHKQLIKNWHILHCTWDGHDKHYPLGRRYSVMGELNFMWFLLPHWTGHFLHLILLPNAATRTLASPIFGTTKETCRLVIFAHQSNNKNGKLRIVIEPANSHDATTSTAWVPIEKNGNDHRKWKEISFSIGRVSQDFRILFEVVSSGLRSQQRGHVRYYSILAIVQFEF